MRRRGPRVLVVAASPRLRDALAAWLRADGGARVVAAVAGSGDLTDAHRFCDLVVASGLGSREELQAIGDRLERRDGLVAFTLRDEPLPAGWLRVAPGTDRATVLDQARAGPDAPLAISNASAATIGLVAAIALGAFAAVAYTPATGVSWQRGALAFATRFPAWDDAWWHTWGAGAPLLADPGWPVLRLAALLGDPSLAFRALTATSAVLCAVAVTLLAARLRSGLLAAAGAGLAVLTLPALWSWVRGGDATSLIGLAGALLAATASLVGRGRIAAVALAIGLASAGGYVWLAPAIAGVVVFSRSDRLHSAVGIALGVALSSALTVPPLLARGELAVLPPLHRPPALSDLAPVAACVLALLGARSARAHGGRRALAGAVAAIGLAGSSALALAVPAVTADEHLEERGPFVRVAASTDRSLRLLTLNPALSVTADALERNVLRAEVPTNAQRARLDWLAVDRALPPDESSALNYYARDWQIEDRRRLVFRGPVPRPLLTAGSTTSILVVADLEDAGVVGDALIRIGATSDIIVPVRAQLPLDALDAAALQRFTAVFVYGSPFRDRGAATRALDDYLGAGGIVILDAGGSTAPGPLVGSREEVAGRPASFVVRGDAARLGSDRPLAEGAPLVSVARPDWEEASLSIGERRVIVVGARESGKAVWSGADLPRRVAAGDAVSQEHLEAVLRWALESSAATSGPWPAPAGNEYTFDDGRATFLAPGRWRIDLVHAVNAVLFKEAAHPFWRAYQVEARSRIPLPILPTTHGFMYVALPPNARRVELVFETPGRDVARGISAAALLGIGASLVLRRRPG